MLHQHSNTELYLKIRALARQMRKNPTEAEDFFWEKVRDRRFFGQKWNRQFIIQCRTTPAFAKFYIPDFHCYQYKLIAELDGQIHLKRQEDDLVRTEHLNQYGFTVVRFSNDQVLNHWEEVEQCLLEYTIGKKSCKH